ncbi:hypothetical protein [Lysobacter sp.]|uniref:hypothetical protein n=1 Tax=Lysobacter sp. TaxID=72226 RepID=UPI002D764994|nr:hypothetical protein [Lysobacter sp.]HZX78809.1 hypothetical protein [Lysobacter sp.]
MALMSIAPSAVAVAVAVAVVVVVAAAVAVAVAVEQPSALLDPEGVAHGRAALSKEARMPTCGAPTPLPVVGLLRRGRPFLLVTFLWVSKEK